MAVSWLTAYRALLLLSLVVGLFVLSQAAVHRDRPGAKPLVLLVTGALLYVSVKLVVSTVRGTPTVFLVTRFNPLGAGLATAGFFLLVLEHTGVENPVSKRTAGGVVLFPAVVSALAAADPEYLWVVVGTDASTLSGYAWDLTSVALANQLYMTLLLLAGIGLLVRRGIGSPGVFTVQAGVLVLSALGPLVGNLVFQFGYVPFNLTPVLFTTSGVLVAWAILQAGFLDLIPIGRETVLDQLDAGVVTLDSDHRVVDLNERGCQLFDVDGVDTVVGDHVDDLFADYPTFGERYWTVAAGDSGDVSPVELDGNHYTVAVVPLGSPEKTVLGRSVIIRDITDQKRREQELEETKRTLEQSNERLDQFATTVSHDLRNPLTIAQGRLELAQAEVESEHLYDVRDAHEWMEALIDDLLTLARQGDLIEETGPVDLAGVAETTWGNMPTAEATLRVETDQTVCADSSRVTDLLANLFRNAVEHAGQDVTVTVGESADGFYVADDGPGIPGEKRGDVFEAGYSTADAGTGFGLNIVRDIVRAHGWAISVTESESGGARFEVTTAEPPD
jgi:nitrogen-specific signal transduction histidine kinase